MNGGYFLSFPLGEAALQPEASLCLLCVVSIQEACQALQLKILAKQDTVAQRDNWPVIEAASEDKNKLVSEECSG